MWNDQAVKPVSYNAKNVIALMTFFARKPSVCVYANIYKALQYRGDPNNTLSALLY